MQHINTVLYYIRKKQKYGNCGYNFTTTNDIFDVYVREWYGIYSEGSMDVKDSVFTLDEVVGYYMRGQRLACAKPWSEVDHVWMPSNIGGTHWVMLCLTFSNRTLYIYDSIRNEGHDESMILNLQCYAVMLPLFMEHAGVWSAKKYRGKLKKIPPTHPLELSFVNGLLQQNDRY